MKRAHPRLRYAKLAAVLLAAIALQACKGGPRPISPPTATVPANAAESPKRRRADAGVLAKATCGAAGLPLCPLEAWMEGELSVPLQSRDWDHLGRSLARLAADPPEGYPRWGDHAKAVLPAVGKKDVEAIRAACKGCHSAYRDDYRLRMPTRPAPAADVAAIPVEGDGVYGRIDPPKPK